MARTATDQKIEEAAEQAAIFLARFVSGAPLSDERRTPGAMPRWQHAALRLAFSAWAAWAGWTWWHLHQHHRVIVASAVAAAVLGPLAVVLRVRGRARREHLRTLVIPMSLALKELMPAWDDAQRLKAVKIPLDRSFVKIALPDGWHGQDGHKEMLRELVHARLGGAWSGEWNLKKYPFNVTFVPAPPRAVHEVPDRVDFFDPLIQEAVAACVPGQIVLGVNDHGEVVTREMTGETAMWALSVGSGGGKSSFLQMVITQLVAQRATVVGIDVKMASITCFEGIDGIHLYTDPGSIADMRQAIAWVAHEVEARNYVKKQDPNKDFDRLTLILEEGNEFGDASKEWWTENKEKGQPAGDPIWGDIASVMRMGRHVNVTLIGVFQDLREAAVGNRGLRNMFRLLLLGNFVANQWRMIVNTSPVPESVDKAGRMMIVEGNRRMWIQVPYATPDQFRQQCIDLRQQRGYSTDDLYGSAPARSPQRLPSLLQVSRPIGARVMLDKPAAGEPTAPAQPREPAASAVREENADAAAVTDVTAPAAEDAPAQHGPDDKVEEHPQAQEETALTGQTASLPEPLTAPPRDEPLADAADSPELLTLSEIARRMAAEGLAVKPGLMRVHKLRRADFPQGRQDPDGGRELYTYDAIADYYRRNPPQV